MPMHRRIVHALTAKPREGRPTLTRAILTGTAPALVLPSPDGGR
jgi:hypothetical protein